MLLHYFQSLKVLFWFKMEKFEQLKRFESCSTYEHQEIFKISNFFSLEINLFTNPPVGDVYVNAEFW